MKSHYAMRIMHWALIALLFIFMSANFCEAKKQNVVVMPLEKMFKLSDSAEDENTVAEIMGEQLIVAIQDSGNYVVLERMQLDRVLKERGFSNVTADPEYQEKLANMYMEGADFVVVGKITMVKTEAADKSTFFKKIAAKFDTPYRTQITLDLRFVKADGVIVMAKTIEANRGGKDAKTSLYNACREAANKFMKSVQEANPFMAQVIGVEGTTIYIKADTDSGIRKDEVLIIAREGSPLVSEGQIIGMTHIEIGKARVVEVNTDFSICRVIEKTEEINVGDVAKRVSK